MNSCNLKIPDIVIDPCSINQGKVSDITIQKNNPIELKVTKVIYNYQAKTEKQMRDIIQLEIDNFLIVWPDYKFVNSKSHFNGMGGIELQLNFELK